MADPSSTGKAIVPFSSMTYSSRVDSEDGMRCQIVLVYFVLKLCKEKQLSMNCFGNILTRL